LTIEELHTAITDSITVNDYDWQREKMYKVNRAKPIRNLDRALFVCPECKSLHNLTFTDDTITCNHCKKTFGLDQYCFVTNSTTVKDLVEWDTLQKSTLLDHIKSNKSDSMILEATCRFNIAHIDKYFKKNNTQSAIAKLYQNKLILELDNETITYNISELYKIYVEFDNTIQFCHKDYKIRLSAPDIKAYIWVTYLNVLNNIA